MKNILTLVLVCGGIISSWAQAQGDLLPLLKQELQADMQELQKKELPPYYMSFRVEDAYKVNLSSSFGVGNTPSEYRLRTFVPQIRLGNKDLDNFKYYSQGAMVSQVTRRPLPPTFLPLEDNIVGGIRVAIWKETCNRYDFATAMYEATKSKAATSVANEDKAPCFSDAQVEKYYEKPFDAKDLAFDTKGWQNKLNEVSALFRTLPYLTSASISLSYDAIRTYFVNTDGSEVVQNRRAVRIMLSVNAKAEDGMELPLNKDYFSFSIDSLPSVEQMKADAKVMIASIEALRKAPLADPYAGPAILSGSASGVFFHEIFGHRLEGHRLKTGGQTFKKMIGDKILPKEFQVYCDPTLRNYNGTDMNGYYLYDDEGVKAHRVNNVVDGVLKEFLMSRVPLDGFPKSNGHGRTSSAQDPVSRQSNLVVETIKPYTDTELRKMLIAEAKKQGKEYGYYFKSVTSGFTYTGDGGSLNSFNVTPTEVYRVFVDGRPDELVRGVDMIGTPLAMFSNIEAAGNTPSTFTGTCGAESGWVPVTASSPTIFVNQVETQRRQQARGIPPVVSAPKFVENKTQDLDEIIFSAMRDELKHNQDSLIIDGSNHPFYLSYIVNRYRQLHIESELGGIKSSVCTPWALAGNTQVLVGSFKKSNMMRGGSLIGMGIPAEPDYSSIRHSLWLASDVAYQYALNEYSQKLTYLKENPLPDEWKDVNDMQRLAPITKLDSPKHVYNIDEDVLKKIATELSSIFNNYKSLVNTGVSVSGVDMQTYRYTSENVQLKQPQGYIKITVSASAYASGNVKISDVLEFVAPTPDELPGIEEMKQRTISFAEVLLARKDAPLVDEYYSGLMLIEDEAVANVFYSNLSGKKGLVASHSLDSKDKSLADKIGRKVIDSKVTVKNYTSKVEYNGNKLIGCYETDGDGVAPESEMTLIDKGVLKMLLNGRNPTPTAPKTTGSARFTNTPTGTSLKTSFGTLHVQMSDGIAKDKMKKELVKRAKAKKQSYAYIVRMAEGGSSLNVYKVDVKSGTETLVRPDQMVLPTLEKLSHIVASSIEENITHDVNNCNTSIIYPSAIIVDDMEMDKGKSVVAKEPALTYPLQVK